MNICLVCSEYPPGPHGGIGTATQLVAQGLRRSGHQVRVAGVYSPFYPGPDYEAAEGIQVWRYRMPLSRWQWMVTRYRFFRCIARWSRDRQIDIVEVPDWQGWAAYWPRLPVPVVVRMHGCAIYHARERGRKPRGCGWSLERACLRRADFLSAVSRYVAEGTLAASGLSRRPAEVLYNSVELPAAALGLSDRYPHRVVFTGTLTLNKGVVSLVDAWPRVKSLCPMAELDVFGKDGRGPDGAASMQKYLQARLPQPVRNSVRFHGHVGRERVFEALSSGRLGVFPSFSEACPLAPLEAMALGCPTVFTKLSCGPEMIRDGIDGVLVDPHHPEEVAEAIACLLKDDALATRLGQAGRLRVAEEFSLKKTLPKIEQFYHQCLEAFCQ